MAELELKLREKYEKRKSKAKSYNTLLWGLSSVLSLIFLLIGILDFLADYKMIRRSDGIPISTYDIRTGAKIDVYPVFGVAFVPTGKQGIIPNEISLNVNDWIVLSFALFIGIPAVFIYGREARILRQIDSNLPYLLREIADAQRIGMHLPRAIAEAAKRNYGPLTPELRKLAAKISWGISFNAAMNAFRKNLNTPLARQATILILEAEKSGGELEEIFDAATHHIQEQLEIKQDRENAIKPYVYIIYVSFLIFCIVVLVLFQTFFNQFGVQPLIVNGIPTIVIPLHAFRVIFLYLITSQAFFSGLTAGKMGNGSVKEGLIHSTILVLVGFVFYKLLIA